MKRTRHYWWGRDAMLRFVCVLVLALLLVTPVRAQSPTPIGVWQDARERIQIEIAPCGDRLCGAILWFRWPNDAQDLPLVDLNNADPALRARPLLGLTILRGLRAVGDNTWADGMIYNPIDGNNYHARMSIQSNGALRVRAYVLLPLIGKTRIWTRVR